MDRVNVVRTRHGLTALTYTRRLQARAQQWADRLAAGHQFTDDPGWRICRGRYWASNVGRDTSVRRVQRAFERSVKHYRNVTDEDFQRVGIGITWAHGGEFAGYVYVVQDFCGG